MPKAIGTAVGFIKDLTAPRAEDVLLEVDEVNLEYLIPFFVGGKLGVGVALLLINRLITPLFRLIFYK